jgi:hypothetical protein
MVPALSLRVRETAVACAFTIRPKTSDIFIEEQLCLMFVKADANF